MYLYRAKPKNQSWIKFKDIYYKETKSHKSRSADNNKK